MATKLQFIAVILVIILGVTLFVSIFGAYRNLLLTKDTYFTEQNLCDFYIYLQKAPYEALKKIKKVAGIKKVSGRIEYDVSVDLNDGSQNKVGRILSVPPKYSKHTINNIYMLKGKYFTHPNTPEVIVNDRFAKANSLKIGQKIFITANNKKQELKIIGFATSPEYVYLIRGIEDFLPNYKDFGLLFITPEFAESILGYKGAMNQIVGFFGDNTLSKKHREAILDNAEKELKSYGVFYKLLKEDQVSNRMISDEIKQLKVSTFITPMMFLGIAAVVIFMIVGRIVKNQRIHIGELISFGYSNIQIFWHYLKYALFVGVIGSGIGLILGLMLSAEYIKLYNQYYVFPYLKYHIYPDVALIGVGMTLSFCAVAGFLSVSKILSLMPAVAMRSESPQAGKKILMEKMTFIWKLLSLKTKIIIRNLFRKKSRFIVGMVSIMLSGSLLIISLSMNDSTNYLLKFEFFEIEKYDLKVMFFEPRSMESINELKRFDFVSSIEPILELPVSIQREWRKKDIAVTGISSDPKLLKISTNTSYNKNLDNGIIVNEKLAQILRLKIGDEIQLKSLKKGERRKRQFIIKGINNQIFGLPCYMDIKTLGKSFLQGVVASGALIKLKKGYDMEAIKKELKKYPAIASTQFKQQFIASFNEAITGTMFVSLFILFIFAGSIAFAVIYNTTIISIMERRIEIAVFKVLGFTDKEIVKIIFNENNLLGICGIAVSLPLGTFLNWLIGLAYDTEMYRFPMIVNTGTYVITIIMLMSFVYLSNVLCMKTIHKIDVVEALKARE